MDISKKILSDPINKWVFKNAGTEVYLVGGYIRDLLIGREAYDKDYVLKSNANELAVKFAKKFQGTFIELKEELTYRVALKGGQFIDFNNFEKEIEGDLLLRDYTINAMAWSPETGIIDPTGGISSLEKKKISTINPKNLQKDPIRVLRAYRIAAQLNFSIYLNTRAYLREYSSTLINSAPERITEELYKLLNSADPLKYLKLCTQDGVFKAIFGVTICNININLGLIAVFDKFIKTSYKFKELGEPISQGLNRLGLIRLSLLMPHDIKRYKTHYFKYLRPSNIIKQKICEIQNAGDLNRGRITNSKLYKIYRAAGTSVLEIALIMASMRIRRRDRQRLIDKAYNYLKIN
jgi:tRNA nucleotidyltransferase/poly(A) polymerase